MSIPSLTLYLSLAVESLALPWQPYPGAVPLLLSCHTVFAAFSDNPVYQKLFPAGYPGYAQNLCHGNQQLCQPACHYPGTDYAQQFPHLLWRHVRVRKGNPLSLLRFSLLLLPCLPDCTYKLHIPALLKYAGTIILPQPFFQGNLFYYVRGLDDNALFFSIWVKQEEIYGPAFYI